jgi:hypothetical protein
MILRIAKFQTEKRMFKVKSRWLRVKLWKFKINLRSDETWNRNMKGQIYQPINLLPASMQNISCSAFWTKKVSKKTNFKSVLDVSPQRRFYPENSPPKILSYENSTPKTLPRRFSPTKILSYENSLYDNSPPEAVFLFVICNVLGVGVVMIYE